MYDNFSNYLDPIARVWSDPQLGHGFSAKKKPVRAVPAKPVSTAENKIGCNLSGVKNTNRLPKRR